MSWLAWLLPIFLIFLLIVQGMSHTCLTPLSHTSFSTIPKMGWNELHFVHFPHYMQININKHKYIPLHNFGYFATWACSSWLQASESKTFLQATFDVWEKPLSQWTVLGTEQCVGLSSAHHFTNSAINSWWPFNISSRLLSWRPGAQGLPHLCGFQGPKGSGLNRLKSADKQARNACSGMKWTSMNMSSIPTLHSLC